MSTKGQGTKIPKSIRIIWEEKGRQGKEKAQMSANVLDIADIRELSITSSKSINFSCYETSEQLNGSWIVDVPTTSHQEKAISSNTGNLDNNIKQKSQMENTSQLKVLEWLSDIA